MDKFVAAPVAYPLCTAIVVYGIGLGVASIGTLAAHIAVSVIWYLYTIFFWVATWMFMREYFRDKVTLRESVLGFINTLFTAVHTVAGVGMTFWLLDTSPGKDVVYNSVPLGLLAAPYNVFLSEFLPTAGNFVLQGGFLAVRPVNGSVLAGLWSLYGSVVGFLTLVVLFGFVNRSIARRAQQARTAVKNKMRLF